MVALLLLLVVVESVVVLVVVLVVESVVVLCLAARFHVGHRTAGVATRTSVFVPKLPHNGNDVIH